METMDVVSATQKTDPAAAKPTSDIVKRADEAQVQASAELLAHLRQMVNEPALSDVVFLCNDGKEVQASRMLLAGRSDVLKSMFMTGMAESNLSEIALPEISSPVLLSVFEFLYTGTLLDYHPQSWGMACEVISASRFFLLPNLEKIIRKFMHSLTSAVAQDLPKAASLLKEAVGFTTLRDGQDVNLQELVTILSSNWSDLDFVSCLSEEAFHYLLSNSKGKCEEADKLTFDEYLRLRQVIRWCVCQSGCEQGTVEALVRSLVPDERRALSMCRNLQNVDEVESPPEVAECLSNFHLNEEVDQSAIRLLSNIDCRQIHPVLLTKVVEPLQLISAADILDSFRFHALRRPMMFKNLGCGWELGEAYSTTEQGYIIHKTRDGVGLAVTTEAMSRSYGLYQWRFTVEEHPGRFCELGFLCYGRGGAAQNPKFNGERLSTQFRARVLNFDGAGASVNCEGAAWLLNWNVSWKTLEIKSRKLSALFTYNASEHSCSLCVHDRDFGVIWKNLPSAIYYPAVSLGTSSLGQVRIELVSGFDIL